MRQFFTYLFLFQFIPFGNSQSIELFGGINQNHFYSFYTDEGHYYNRHNYENNFTYGIGINEVKLKKINFAFSLKYDQYSGTSKQSNGSLCCTETANGSALKQIIGLDIYPINFKVVEHLIFSFGVEINYLLYENTVGELTSYTSGGPYLVYPLANGSPLLNFGLMGRIGYQINLGKNWYLKPNYMYYWGLTNELGNLTDTTKSMRHYLTFAVGRIIK